MFSQDYDYGKMDSWSLGLLQEKNDYKMEADSNYKHFIAIWIIKSFCPISLEMAKVVPSYFSEEEEWGSIFYFFLLAHAAIL